MLHQRWVLGAVVVPLGLFLVSVGRADEARAAKAVQMLGGRVMRALNRPYIGTVILSKCKVTDKDLKVLTEFKNLTVLALDGTQITDEGLKELKAFKELTSLNISSTQVTDEGLKELDGLKKLTKLYISNTKTTTAGRSELKESLPKLKISFK